MNGCKSHVPHVISIFSHYLVEVWMNGWYKNIHIKFVAHQIYEEEPGHLLTGHQNKQQNQGVAKCSEL